MLHFVHQTLDKLSDVFDLFGRARAPESMACVVGRALLSEESAVTESALSNVSFSKRMARKCSNNRLASEDRDTVSPWPVFVPSAERPWVLVLYMSPSEEAPSIFMFPPCGKILPPSTHFRLCARIVLLRIERRCRCGRALRSGG